MQILRVKMASTDVMMNLVGHARPLVTATDCLSDRGQSSRNAPPRRCGGAHVCCPMTPIFEPPVHTGSGFLPTLVKAFVLPTTADFIGTLNC